MRNMWSFVSYLGRLRSSLFTPALLEHLSTGEKLKLLRLEPACLLPHEGEEPGECSLQFPSFCNTGLLPRRQLEWPWANAPGQPHLVSWVGTAGPRKGQCISAHSGSFCCKWPFLTSGLLSDLGATECWVMGSQDLQSDLGSTFPILQVTNSPNLSSLSAVTGVKNFYTGAIGRKRGAGPLGTRTSGHTQRAFSKLELSWLAGHED